MCQASKEGMNSNPWFRKALITHSFKFGRLISGPESFTYFQHNTHELIFQ